LSGITNDSKIKWADAHIRRKAKTWLASAELQLHSLSGQQFYTLLSERFPTPLADDSMEQCQVLKQLNTVDNYIVQFEDWMSLMKKDHPYLTENFFLLRFLSGLKDTIKHDTKCHKPSTLRTAYWFARQQEQSYLSNNKKQNTTPRTTQTTTVNRAQPARDNRARTLPNKPRESGKCLHCPENWTYGHKCDIVKTVLHAIQLQGHSDEEEEIHAEIPVADVVPEQQEVPQPAGHLMSISAEALQGIAGDDTISLLLMIQGKPAIALVDSGSSCIFLDRTFAIKHNLSMRATPPRTITVAGGGTIISDVVVTNCPYSIQKKKFTSDFKILPLKGYDIVLGVAWLKQFSPTTFDWIARSVTITEDNVQYTFTDHLEKQQSHIISATQCNAIVDTSKTYLLSRTLLLLFLL
jgi:hypothetical protein